MLFGTPTVGLIPWLPGRVPGGRIGLLIVPLFMLALPALLAPTWPAAPVPGSAARGTGAALPGTGAAGQVGANNAGNANMNKGTINNPILPPGTRPGNQGINPTVGVPNNIGTKTGTAGTTGNQA